MFKRVQIIAIIKRFFGIPYKRTLEDNHYYSDNFDVNRVKTLCSELKKQVSPSTFRVLEEAEQRIDTQKEKITS